MSGENDEIRYKEKGTRTQPIKTNKAQDIQSYTQKKFTRIENVTTEKRAANKKLVALFLCLYLFCCNGL